MYYFEILEGLYERKIRYLIVGGLSVNLYGVPRVTQDIDIIISTDRENILKIITLLKNQGYVPRLPVNPEDLADSDKVKDWIENRNLKAFSFYHKKDNYKVVDILLVHPLDFEESFKNRNAEKSKKISGGATTRRVKYSRHRLTQIDTDEESNAVKNSPPAQKKDKISVNHYH